MRARLDDPKPCDKVPDRKKPLPSLPDLVAEGIWLVGEKGKSCVHIGPVPEPVEFAKFAAHRDEIAAAIQECWKEFLKNPSPQRMADAIIDAVYRKEAA